MDVLTQTIINILWTIIMSISNCIVLDVFCRRKKLGLKKLVMYAFIALIFLVAINVIFELRQYAIVLIIFSAIWALSIYEERIISKLWMILVAIGLQYGGEVASVVILNAMIGDRTFNPAIEWLLANTSATIPSVCICYSICVLIRKMGVSGKDRAEYREINKKQIITLMILGFSCIFTVFLVQCLYLHEVLGSVNTVIALYIGIAGNIYLIVGVDESMSKKYYQKINQIMQEHFRNQVDYYKSLETMSKETRAIKHDMQNHLIVMQGLIGQAKYEELDKYVERIKSSVIRSHAVIQTGNPVIDAIINEKNEVAKERQIPMEINISIPTNISIEVVDLCIMVANSIDNALEACERINDITKRYIKIDVKVVQGYFIFEIINSMVNEKIKIKDNTIVTSKLDPFNHGFGLGNIRSSVDKYAGDFEIQAHDYEFRLGITINVKENAFQCS